MFRIHVYLPKDRNDAGWLNLAGPDGALRLYNIPCRGKADNERAAREGNPSRDPTRPYGDTPSGTYDPERIVQFDPPHHRLGRWFLPLRGAGGGASGDALLADERGRTGLGIHAGRGDGRLITTYGCLRLHDRDMAEIAAIVGAELVTVTIEDI